MSDLKVLEEQLFPSLVTLLRVVLQFLIIIIIIIIIIMSLLPKDKSTYLLLHYTQ